MKIPAIVVMDESGAVAFDGSLANFLRANRDGIDRHTLCAELRDGMTQAHGRPEPAIIGGGAAPAFYVSLAA